MGKPNGFMEFERTDNSACSPLERIKNYNEFHSPLSEDERKKQEKRFTILKKTKMAGCCIAIILSFVAGRLVCESVAERTE